MRTRLFTLLSVTSLLLCVATAAAWIRAHSHEDWRSFTTSPYDHPVQHYAGYFSGNGRLMLELHTNYRPRLLISNGSSGEMEQFDENGGWEHGADPITTPEPWPLWGKSA